jgi:hypothetical protein
MARAMASWGEATTPAAPIRLTPMTSRISCRPGMRPPAGRLLRARHHDQHRADEDDRLDHEQPERAAPEAGGGEQAAHSGPSRVAAPQTPATAP